MSFLFWNIDSQHPTGPSVSLVTMTSSIDLSAEVPPHSDDLEVSFPQEHVLLLTLNRPRYLNAVSRQLNDDLTSVLRWFDEEPSLWCVIQHRLTSYSCVRIKGCDCHWERSRLLRGRRPEIVSQPSKAPPHSTLLYQTLLSRDAHVFLDGIRTKWRDEPPNKNPRPHPCTDSQPFRAATRRVNR